eukprot:3509107-Lingulodinium_polyedra.AAC.1
MEWSHNCRTFLLGPAIEQILEHVCWAATAWEPRTIGCHSWPAVARKGRATRRCLCRSAPGGKHR